MERPQFAYPLRLGPDGDFVCVEQGTDAEVAVNINLILDWPLGFRRSDPNYGVALGFDDAAEALGEIAAAVAEQEPAAAAHPALLAEVEGRLEIEAAFSRAEGGP